jgi:type IV pilus assembly protein PilF
MMKHETSSSITSVPHLSQPITVLRYVASITAAIAVITLAACSTTSTTETKVADIAGKTSPTQRAQIHTERAGEYFRMGKMSVALEAVQQAVSSASNYAPAHNMLALIYMELREDVKAQAAFEQALKIAPEDSDVLNNFGWFICQRQDPVKALGYFDRAVRNPLYSTPQRALYNAGVCARMGGSRAQAETYFQRALMRDAQFAAALGELADLAFAQNRMKEAESYFERYTAILREPDANTLLLGAKIARANGNRNNEAGYISQLRRRFPDSPQAREATLR